MIDPNLEQLISMGGESSDQEDEINRQLQKAQMLRKMPQAQGGQVGRVPWSPSAITTILGGANQFGAGQLEGQAAAGKKNLNANRQAQMAMLMRLLQQEQPQPSQAQGPGMMPPGPGMGGGIMPGNQQGQGLL